MKTARWQRRAVFFYVVMQARLDVVRERRSLIGMKDMKHIWVAVVVFGVCLWGLPAQAQTITEVNQLYFGTFGISDNDSVSAITVTPDNDTFSDPAIISDQPGQRGEYTLTGFPPNVSFYLGVEVTNPPAEGGIVLANPTDGTMGGAEVFTLDTLEIADGGVLQTDGAGDAVLYIGGTLRTSGNGLRYPGGNYSGTYTITIHY